MKEHKNPKVLSEGLLWMVSAVDDFGISYVKLKVIKTSSETLLFSSDLTLFEHRIIKVTLTCSIFDITGFD